MVVQKEVKRFFIDAPTRSDGMKIYRKFVSRKSTVSITKPEQYYFNGTQPECILYLDTTLSEADLDALLYKAAHIDYIGIGISNKELA